MFPGPHGTIRALMTPVSSSSSQRNLCQVALAVGVPADPAPRAVRGMEHHERPGSGGVDRPDRARHVRERVAVEHVWVALQLPQDDRAVRSLLLVEGPVSAYVVDKGHGGIVAVVYSNRGMRR